ncbi:MAG TPA: DUF2334 domain-containing protein [Tissierellia bacterium]|jgi:hypothetical protein|nr:DUF2334 domain-containing protein [Tissierellia bacterium]
MSKYIMRLDDACEKMDVEKWNRMEELLDKYNIKPLVGVIPHCEDPMMDQYQTDSSFWEKVHRWKNKGWTIALHGYNHVYSTECGGINPVNKRSEFAGLPLERQKEKIKKGVMILNEHGIYPKVFFAPSHTFDENTLTALKEETEIRIISDTIAWNSYKKDEFTFVPQQSGRVRKLPLKTVTFCYHPNVMSEQDFDYLEKFLIENRFSDFSIEAAARKQNVFEKILQRIYWRKHRK